jgi:hypothetical protein
MILCCSKCFSIKYGDWLRQKIASDYERDFNQKVQEAIQEQVSQWFNYGRR